MGVPENAYPFYVFSMIALLLSVGSEVQILSGTPSGSLKYGFPFFYTENNFWLP
jgi:hypothetical protein